MIVVGAGAAGLFAALAARGAIAADGSLQAADEHAPSVHVIDGQDQPGRKILISGGGRCNVTNAVVTQDDFWSGQPRLVRNSLRAFGPDQVRRFFDDAGVPLKAEPLGKLFPLSDRAHDVLEALQSAAAGAGVTATYGQPVARLEAADTGWLVNDLEARRVVVATGGLSVPATGSTGFGLDLAARLGHRMTAAVPALAPLHGAADADLAGITVAAILSVLDETGRELTRAAGSMLFTHRGVTGPVALDVSGEVEVARLDGVTSRVTADLWTLADPSGPFAEHLAAPKLPGCCLADPPRPTTAGDLDGVLAQLAEALPNRTVEALLGMRLPKRLATAVAGQHAETPAGQLRREDRRHIATRTVSWPVDVVETGGYAKAEVTRGGVPLDELDRVTLESRLAPGMHFCGEVCDVTGRLGGFNFQWAWTSGWLAGRGAAAGLR